LPAVAIAKEGCQKKSNRLYLLNDFFFCQKGCYKIIKSQFDSNFPCFIRVGKDMILVHSLQASLNCLKPATQAITQNFIFVNVPFTFEMTKIKRPYMNRFLAAGMFFAMIISFACRNRDKEAELRSSKEVSPESIFLDYQVMGEEGNDSITLLLQFRSGGEYGGTLLLDSPSTVQLDGELIKGDSARVTGAYYEIQKPVETFAGHHSIFFSYDENKIYKQDFQFQPMTFLTELPAVVYRDSLVLSLKGLDAGDVVRVVLTDTLFGSEGVDRLDTVTNGHIIITREELKTLTYGPVQLQLVKESETAIKNGRRRSGRLYMSYRLKREFLLERKPE
jgi:hypothetical protein